MFKFLVFVAIGLFAPTLWAANPNSSGGSGSGGPDFGIVGGMFTDASMAPLLTLQRAQNVGHLTEVYVSPAAYATGTANGGTTNSLTLATTPFAVDELVGMGLRITQATVGSPTQRRLTIVSNTAGAISFTPSLPFAVASTDTFEVYEGVLVPGDDTNGDGTQMQPYGSLARISQLLAEPNVKVVADCATFLSSRDRGTNWDGTLNNTGITAAECPTGRICSMLTTPLECDGRDQSSMRLEYDQNNFPQGALKSSVTDVWLAIENVTVAADAIPRSGTDTFRVDGSAPRVFLLNVEAEGKLGTQNQFITSHGLTDTQIISLNGKATFNDHAPFASLCSSNGYMQFATFSSIDLGTEIITTTAPHGLQSYEGPYVIATTGTAPAGITAETFPNGGRTYFIEVLSTTTLKLHDTNPSFTDGFNLNNEVDISDAGTGTHTIEVWAESCSAAATIDNGIIDGTVLVGGNALEIGGQYLNRNTTAYGIYGYGGQNMPNYWNLWSSIRHAAVSPVLGLGLWGVSVGPASAVPQDVVVVGFNYYNSTASSSDRCITTEYTTTGVDVDYFLFGNTCIGADRGYFGPGAAATGVGSYWEACNVYDDMGTEWWRSDVATSFWDTFVAVDVLADDGDQATSMRVSSTDYPDIAGALAGAGGDIEALTTGNIFFSDAGSNTNVTTDPAGGTIPNKGPCVSADCRETCSYAFTRTFPHDEWKTIWIDIIGEQVNGISLNSGLDGNKGAPLNQPRVRPW